MAVIAMTVAAYLNDGRVIDIADGDSLSTLDDDEYVAVCDVIASMAEKLSREMRVRAELSRVFETPEGEAIEE